MVISKGRKKSQSIFDAGLGFGLAPSKNHSNPLNLGIDFRSAQTKEVERDSRRAFSDTQKSEIWDRQEGMCAGVQCGNKPLLRRATHFDHIIPWEIGGKTIVSNGQALCTICHSIKTHGDKLKQVDKKRKPKNNDSGLVGIFGQSSKRSKNLPWGF